jgi:hypothetical protein
MTVDGVALLDTAEQPKSNTHSSKRVKAFIEGIVPRLHLCLYKRDARKPVQVYRRKHVAIKSCKKKKNVSA